MDEKIKITWKTYMNMEAYNEKNAKGQFEDASAKYRTGQHFEWKRALYETLRFIKAGVAIGSKRNQSYCQAITTWTSTCPLT